MAKNKAIVFHGQLQHNVSHYMVIHIPLGDVFYVFFFNSFCKILSYLGDYLQSSIPDLGASM